jgi:hypothetical protein
MAKSISGIEKISYWVLKSTGVCIKTTSGGIKNYPPGYFKLPSGVPKTITGV